MITDNEFLEIIQGLYQKTAKENLKWQRGPTGYDAAPRPCDYWVQLPQSVIEIHFGNPPTEPDFITFTLARGLGAQTPLAGRKVYEGEIGWTELHNLYALVERRVGGWDEVFNNVREFLGKEKSPAAS